MIYWHKSGLIRGQLVLRILSDQSKGTGGAAVRVRRGENSSQCRQGSLGNVSPKSEVMGDTGVF